jgi:hypothetical protein
MIIWWSYNFIRSTDNKVSYSKKIIRNDSIRIQLKIREPLYYLKYNKSKIKLL